MPAANMRFGAMAAEARNNGSANFKESCDAERLLEAATASSRCPVIGNLGDSDVLNLADSKFDDNKKVFGLFDL